MHKEIYLKPKENENNLMTLAVEIINIWRDL